MKKWLLENMEIWIPVLVSLITIIGGFITWYLNERSKRINQEFERKEARYIKILTNLRGFYVDSHNHDLKSDFLQQVNLMWLYCPDEVIKKAYEFLDKVHTDNQQSGQKKEAAVGALILAIRNDLLDKKHLKKTKLKPDDFKHLRAT